MLFHMTCMAKAGASLEITWQSCIYIEWVGTAQPCLNKVK